MEELKYVVSTENPSVISVLETWVASDKYDSRY